jgi:hypothetical protein
MDTAPPSPLERALAEPPAGDGLRCVALEQHEHWADGATRPLRALFDPARGERALVLTDDVDGAEALAGGEATPAQAAEALAVPLLDAARPLALAPHTEPKPWGRELWYTGIEARGVSGVRGGADDAAVPLPWVLTALPGRFGGVTEPVLLKILDPHPDPRLGDLYFELHEEKQEVYVVTGVDAGAWPDGHGAIRMGLDATRLEALGDAGLRAVFGAAVRDYEIVRRRIDARLDERRDAAGVPRDAALDPETERAWTEALPEALREQERRLREAVLELTALEPLAVGDVVRIPRGVPHALQHGVRVVEFQTPVYERRILFFAQKVLTQDHWDTPAALGRMTLRPPAPEPTTPAMDGDGVHADWIVAFDGFRVLRLRLEAGARCVLPAASHGVLMGVAGEAVLGGTTLGPEAAALVPGAALAAELTACADGATALLALPAAADGASP